MKRWTVSIVAFSALLSHATWASAQALPSPTGSTAVPTEEATVAPIRVTVPPLPSPSPEPTPAPYVEPNPPIDGAYSLPGGIWNCETLGNSTAVSVYKMTATHTMVERTTLRLPHRPPVEIDTTFVYSPKSGRWGLSMQKGSYVASAPAWSDPTWIFDGKETDADPQRRVRLVYTSLGPDAYRSDFEALSKRTWQTFSGATCKRMQP